MPGLWEVIGGASTGGIIVRVGKGLDSRVKDTRLSTGAVVEELELVDGRLHFAGLVGSDSSPQEGWVSLRCKGRPMLVKRIAAAETLPAHASPTCPSGALEVEVRMLSGDAHLMYLSPDATTESLRRSLVDMGMPGARTATLMSGSSILRSADILAGSDATSGIPGSLTVSIVKETGLHSSGIYVAKTDTYFGSSEHELCIYLRFSTKRGQVDVVRGFMSFSDALDVFHDIEQTCTHDGNCSCKFRLDESRNIRFEVQYPCTKFNTRQEFWNCADVTCSSIGSGHFIGRHAMYAGTLEDWVGEVLNLTERYCPGTPVMPLIATPADSERALRFEFVPW